MNCHQLSIQVYVSVSFKNKEGRITLISMKLESSRIIVIEILSPLAYTLIFDTSENIRNKTLHFLLFPYDNLVSLMSY